MRRPLAKSIASEQEGTSDVDECPELSMASGSASPMDITLDGSQDVGVPDGVEGREDEESRDAPDEGESMIVDQEPSLCDSLDVESRGQASGSGEMRGDLRAAGNADSDDEPGDISDGEVSAPLASGTGGR